MNNSVQVETFQLGPLETNCYVVASGGRCWVVDPGGKTDPVIKFIKDNQLALEMIVLTHGHWDHIGGVPSVKRQYPDVPVAIHQADAEALTNGQTNLSISFSGKDLRCPAPEMLLNDGEKLKLADSVWQVLHCPGHTPGGISLYCAQAAIALVGDALFAGSIGRTDLPGGSPEALLTAIRQKLLTLPPKTAILPGHGPATTVASEKSDNPWL